MLHLVRIQVIWDMAGSEPSHDHTFCYGNGNDNHHSGTGSVCMGIISAAEKAEFVMTGCHETQRGHWYDATGSG